MRASSLKVSIIMLAMAVGLAAPVLAQDDPVTTTRDERGVWYIEGGDLYDVFEAMGYAVATDRMFQIDLFRRQGNGRLSELLGPSQVSTDIGLRMFSYSDAELTQMFEALSPDTQTAVQAYVDGINRRIAEYPTNWFLMPHEYWILSFQSVFQLRGGSVLPAPWTVNDVLHWMVTLTRFFDPEGDFASDNFGQLDNYVLFQTLAAVYPQEYLAMFTDLRWINDPGALTYIPSVGAKSAAMTQLQLPMLAADGLPDLSGAAANLRARANQIESSLEALNARVKMGSYAWAVSGDKTESGNPIVYSGPQMGFETPSIVVEGSIRGGGLEVSGMTVPGIPMIIIGRTPHHAWSMQVGHAHTVDFYLEAPQSVSLHRMETIKVRAGQNVTIPIFRSPHGPVIEPFPYNPADPPDVIVSWAYSHWGKELQSLDAFFELAQAESIAEFDAGIEKVAVSQHFTYADRDGNIAYWMAGYDPVRAPGVDPRFPSIGNGQQEWTGARKPRVHDANNPQGYYGGWNNKSALSYPNATNNYSYYFGPAHRAHVIDEYLAANDNLTYEEVRDLALSIATTDSFGGGGNTWSFVADAFSAAVAADPTASREAAIAMLNAWDGHFVAGGPSQWRMGAFRADAWVFQDAWIKEVLRLTFEDEFMMAGMDVDDQREHLLFNVLLRALAGPQASIPTFYNWFQDKSGSGKPTTADGIILQALDTTIAAIGLGPYNAQRGFIVYTHPIFGKFWQTPFSSRSTYAHCVEFDSNGPARIESMFPLGESGALYFAGTTTPSFDPHNFSMVPVYDPFMPRSFPLFD